MARFIHSLLPSFLPSFLFFLFEGVRTGQSLRLCILSSLDLLLRSLTRAMNYFNRYAFCYVAIYGFDFVQSSKFVPFFFFFSFFLFHFFFHFFYCSGFLIYYFEDIKSNFFFISFNFLFRLLHHLI